MRLIAHNLQRQSPSKRVTFFQPSPYVAGFFLLRPIYDGCSMHNEAQRDSLLNRTSGRG